MPATKAMPSLLYGAHKAAASHERFTMDAAPYAQRDNANASAAEAWQRVAELEAALAPLADLAEHYRAFDFAPATADMTQLGEYITVAHVRRARELLARKPA